MVDLKTAPFNLDENSICWVTATLNKMSLKEKIGHLFFPVGLSSDHAELEEVITRFKPAGMMFRPGPSEEVQETHRFLQMTSDLPLLIASNLESGGNGSSINGTEFASQMQVAATDELYQAENLAQVCATEGSALGCNWSFAPVIDLDLNPENPITNVRTFGSDVKRVKSMAAAYIKKLQGNGVASAAKHFPGDGVDSRDQHIAMTYNTLSCEEWDASYGEVYRAVIESGVLSIMAGHISLPAYSRHFNPDIAIDQLMPASLAPELLQGLLRDKLGFNGLIVTDATAMVGFTTAMPREKAVPSAIAAGCDIFLFNKDLEEDFQFMLNGIETGLLSLERVDEAVTRTLAMKAALGLHHQSKEERVPASQQLEVVGCEQHKRMAEECANKAITLVKDRTQFLPVDINTHKRILVFTLSDDGDFFGHKNSVFDTAVDLLRAEGFEVTLFDPKDFMSRDTKLSVSSVTKNYDFALYLANQKPASNKTSLRLNWARPMGANAPWFSTELPTVFVSFGNPYHLLDVPKVPTYINAYTATEATIKAVTDCLLGRAEFCGISPVDAFMGRWDTRL